MDLSVTWIGQGGYIIEFDHNILCIDPYLSDEVERIEGLKRLLPPPFQPEDLKVDYIIFTHDHLDHFDEPSIRRITDKNIKYIGPTSCAERLKGFLGDDKAVMTLNRNETLLLDSVKLHAVYTKHTEDSIGLVIQQSDRNSGGVYLTGDTEYCDRLHSVKKYEPELMIGCINGMLGNMSYVELASLGSEIGVKMIIPSHYGMFLENTEDPKKLERLIRNSDLLYFELDYNKKTQITLEE